MIRVSLRPRDCLICADRVTNGMCEIDGSRTLRGIDRMLASDGDGTVRALSWTVVIVDDGVVLTREWRRRSDVVRSGGDGCRHLHRGPFFDRDPGESRSLALCPFLALTGLSGD